MKLTAEVENQIAKIRSYAEVKGLSLNAAAKKLGMIYAYQQLCRYNTKKGLPSATPPKARKKRQVTVTDLPMAASNTGSLGFIFGPADEILRIAKAFA